MYTNKQKTDIYIYDINKQQYLFHFKSIDELILTFAKIKAGDFYWCSFEDNEIVYLDEINLTTNDVIYSISNHQYKLRPYVFLDADLRIVDVRAYEKQITDLAQQLNEEIKHKENNYLKGDYLKSRNNAIFRYRIGSVPGTGSHIAYKNFLRSPKTTQELRLNCKYKGFVRSKRKSLPTLYDDVIRSNDRSWKTNTKCKHQWQKNLE